MNLAVHLTEEQIDDYLIGDLDGDVAKHLASCETCLARVAELDGAIQSFTSVSLAWSERQSATMPIRPAGIRQKRTRTNRMVWTATAAAALVVGAAIPLARHNAATARHAGETQATSVPVRPFAEEREEQIAQDNQMLQAIDREIGASVSSPSEMFGFETGAQVRHTAQSGTIRD